MRARPYADAPVVRIDVLAAAREQLKEELSLADINRFQFRRNRSEEPGLPRKQAEGSDPDEIIR